MSRSAGAIEAVLEESGPDYETFSSQQLTGGTRAAVYRVTLQYEGTEYEVVVKFAPETGSTFAVEPFLHEFIAERTDVPLPGILVFEEDPDQDVPPYFVTERMHGTNLDERFEGLALDQRSELLEAVGRILGDLHSTIAFEGYGRLALRDGRLSVRDFSSDWRAYFADLTRGHIDGLAATTFEDLQDTARERLRARLSTVPRQGIPRVVHDDFRPGNLLFEPDGTSPISAVLDWEQTLAGEPMYNLAQVEFLFIDSVFRDPEECEQLRAHLHDGYRSERDFDPDQRYAKSKPLYQFSTLLWRMGGFDDLYDGEGSLARSRAEAYYRRQFDDLAATLGGE
ncbi:MULTISPECIES: phosphotransferase family protein [unclassified Halorhabdus]|uniref:phosphotransferase family protein n=1 Tax=unclassified Halorhabdus TaxID=2621901 RepID=UPI001E378245|nr:MULTISPECIES: phosphotransferase family protein [unclassified Halorhabdus]